MYPVNNQFYANHAMMPRIMAEDVGVWELQDPLVYTRTEKKNGVFGRMCAFVKGEHRRTCKCQKTNTVCTQC